MIGEPPEMELGFQAGDLPLKPRSPPKKPAILGSTGNIAPVPYLERAKPAAKPRVDNPPEPVVLKRRPRAKRSSELSNWEYS